MSIRKAVVAVAPSGNRSFHLPVGSPQRVLDEERPNSDYQDEKQGRGRTEYVQFRPCLIRATNSFTE